MIIKGLYIIDGDKLNVSDGDFWVLFLRNTNAGADKTGLYVVSKYDNDSVRCNLYTLIQGVQIVSMEYENKNAFIVINTTNPDASTHGVLIRFN